jgi:hypothetical protein
MRLTIDLPEQVEQAYQAAARAKGVSVDALVSDVLLSHTPIAVSAAQPAERPQLREERGIPVLRTGQPISQTTVDETIESIRREREQSVLGL